MPRENNQAGQEREDERSRHRADSKRSRRRSWSRHRNDRHDERGRTGADTDRASRPQHRDTSRHRDISRRRSNSTKKLDSGQDDPPSDDLYKKTSEFTKRQIIRGTGGQYPNNWNFSVEVSKIEAGKWNTRDVNGNLVPKCAYLVQSDISITKSKFVKQFQLDIWHAPLLADATIEQGAHLEHSGPEHLKGEVLEVHRENEIGTDATLEVGTGQAALQAGVHTTNNTSYDFNVYGGLKTQHSVSEKRQKITCEVYERKLEQERDGGSGVPHKVRVYALIVCPQAVALDISAEIEFTWRKKGWPPSSLKNPVFYKGSWCTIPLPEVPWRPEELDFSTWGQEEYKNVAGNRCVTGEVSY